MVLSIVECIPKRVRLIGERRKKRKTEGEKKISRREKKDFSPLTSIVRDYEQLLLAKTATAFSILICFLAVKDSMQP